MTYDRKKKKVPVDQRNQQEEILHFSLSGLLETDHVLTLNPNLGTLSHLMCKDGQPRLLMGEQFRASEIRVLLPLLEAFPYYCPYEMVLASFGTGSVTEEATLYYQRRLLQARQEPAQWEEILMPIRGVLSRTRIKLRQFGLEISSISETGYLLRSLPRLPKSQTPGHTTASLGIPV
ncbi:hypothetical protein KDA_76220 [Dictyobacter alpinus]|uniref:OmpR/PhoB-type domain-containing protein n=1 Tax=Dictyobacter alpinus TaxID=2014873 RepID=A0A402BL97_9CHLR|nr:hypothetical protein [Dictyobacter alpinus]GCE32138.1 hypothetical protein KDA_76220 [Dictyobacter alpinus]